MNAQNELWKDIPNYDHYQVSSFGRIRKKNKGKKVNWIFTSKRLRSGYPVARLTDRQGRRQVLYIHRLVAEAFLENPKDDSKYVNHKDGKKANNHFLNLEWCTMQHNTQHSWDNGLQKSGVYMAVAMNPLRIVLAFSLNQLSRKTSISIADIAAVRSGNTISKNYEFKII
jgi:hypothetical protein